MATKKRKERKPDDEEWALWFWKCSRCNLIRKADPRAGYCPTCRNPEFEPIHRERVAGSQMELFHV